MKLSNNRKIIVTILVFFTMCVTACSFSELIYFNSSIIYAKEAIINFDDEVEHLEIFSQNGAIEKAEVLPLAPKDNNETGIILSKSEPNFNEQKIFDSGKPDSESLVITVMGDGFTSGQQNDFIDAAQSIIESVIGNPSKGIEGFYPYNLFRDLFTVYAIEVISNESGVSRDANINNGNIIDNYFGSSYYYGNNSSTVERALVVTNKDRVRALEKPGSSMAVVICNSSRWGGTGGEFSVISLATGAERILKHEFGHSLGNLADEYYYPSDGAFRIGEAPNKTADNNINTIKWKEWLGYSNVDIYPYSTGVDITDPNFDSTSNSWYKPHTNCAMQYSNSTFCPVCSAALIEEMELRVGSLFTTSQVGTSSISIDTVNLSVSGTFKIPERIYGKTVVQIGLNAFANQGALTGIVLPDTITSIGANAFENCTNLTSISGLNNIVSIGAQAFKGCSSLTNISIPAGTTSIGAGAFANCDHLTSITLPSGITTVSRSLFRGCSALSSVTIPNSVTEIKGYAFYDCLALASITLPSSVTTIGAGVFANCKHMNSISLSSGVTTIGERAFANCYQLANISLPSSVTTIGEMAFEYCYHLTNISLPSGMTTISESLFRGCSALSSVMIPNSVTEIEDYAFYGCSALASITLPSNLTTIGDCAFKNCDGLISVYIPSNVTAIGRGVFMDCDNLEEVDFSDNTNITAISKDLFRDCVELTSLCLSPTMTDIGNYAYSGCEGLPTNVVLPSGITSIGYGAFMGCDNITSVTIPSGVTTLESSLFENCSSLTGVTFLGNVTTIESFAFRNCPLDSSFAIPLTVTYIGAMTFDGCTGLTSLYIPANTIYFSHDSFKNCVNLESITVDPNNTRFSSSGNCMIYNNSVILGCKNSVIPANVNKLDDYAFAGQGITEITIPSNITYLGDCVFEGCPYLENATFQTGGNVNFISFSLFENCVALEEVTLSGYMEYILDQAFYNCQSLKIVNNTETIKYIGFHAFERCYDLYTLFFIDDTMFGDANYELQEIDDYAFYDSGLVSMLIPSTVERIGDYAFYKSDYLYNVIVNAYGLIDLGVNAFDETDAKIVFLQNCAMTDVWSQYYDRCVFFEDYADILVLDVDFAIFETTDLNFVPYADICYPPFDFFTTATIYDFIDISNLPHTSLYSVLTSNNCIFYLTDYDSVTYWLNYAWYTGRDWVIYIQYYE